MPRKLIMLYLVSYDVREDKRRNQIAETLEGFGERVQFSVFECLLTTDQFDVLLRRLRSLIDPATDSIRCYRLCNACVDEIVIDGQGEVTSEEAFYLF